MILAWASPFKSGLGFWSGVLWSDNLWAQKHNPLINSDIRQIMIVCQVCVSTTVILSLSPWTSGGWGGGGASGTPGFSKLTFIITSLFLDRVFSTGYYFSFKWSWKLRYQFQLHLTEKCSTAVTPCKVKIQYLLTFQVSRYYILGSQSRVAWHSNGWSVRF